MMPTASRFRESRRFGGNSSVGGFENNDFLKHVWMSQEQAFGKKSPTWRVIFRHEVGVICYLSRNYPTFFMVWRSNDHDHIVFSPFRAHSFPFSEPKFEKKNILDFFEFKSLDSPRNPSVWVLNFSPKWWNVFGGYGAQFFSDLGWRIQVLMFLRNNSIHYSIHYSIHDSDESGDLHHTGRIWVVASMFNCNISVEQNNNTLFASISNDDIENANGPQISLVRCGCSSIWRNVPHFCQLHLYSSDICCYCLMVQKSG